MDKRFWAIVGVIVVVFGGIIFFNNKNEKNTAGDSGKATNHITGKLDSKVTLTEYGDYQCSVCESYYSVVHEVQQKYADKIAFQFRNLPLSQVHPNAFAAARAAEAADLQGKFWEMHDLLYAPQNWQEWTGSSKPTVYFENYAKSLKLDVAKFKTDFASAKVNSRINADVEAFNKTKQQMGTPTFFLNGKYVANSEVTDKTSGVPTVESFSKVIDAELAKTGAAAN
jgi:protein-disulfide isomerase